MITTSYAATAISTLISVGGIWVLLNYWYPDLLIDLFRQRLFNLRARLFEFAADGHVDFDDLAYCRLRTQLNGYIRFAHRIDAFQLFFISAFLREELRAQVGVADPVREWAEALPALPEDVRARLVAFRDEMHDVLVTHLMWGSILLLPVLLPILVLTGAWWLLTQIARHTVSSLRDLQNPFGVLSERVAARADTIIGTIDALELAT